ncbi:hypothetical protein GYMLUDRAFT_982601 [Collybiopsis luxurians FD-317 M1]|uniref:Uncharacterized protein n=1 Tax=Collybiopsis luxurians FD-317 M1 TaxID=944289 RepID=A0A0D0C0P5_9AGAR|nr:hypothetical protein GYMLUDRAFT_982601 [Collybiopsis luxurians FD-317 M1]
MVWANSESSAQAPFSPSVQTSTEPSSPLAIGNGSVYRHVKHSGSRYSPLVQLALRNHQTQAFFTSPLSNIVHLFSPHSKKSLKRWPSFEDQSLPSSNNPSLVPKSNPPKSVLNSAHPMPPRFPRRKTFLPPECLPAPEERPARSSCTLSPFFGLHAQISRLRAMKIVSASRKSSAPTMRTMIGCASSTFIISSCRTQTLLIQPLVNRTALNNSPYLAPRLIPRRKSRM